MSHNDVIKQSAQGKVHSFWYSFTQVQVMLLLETSTAVCQETNGHFVSTMLYVGDLNG